MTKSVDEIISDNGSVRNVRPLRAVKSDGPRIRLTPFDQIKLGIQPRYLVSTLIPQTGLAVVWGPPKCGKSFWAFDLMMHVALDWEYRGLRTHGGPVVYCCFEGQAGIQARAEAFRQRFLTDVTTPVPFYLTTIALDLVTDREELIEAIRSQIGEDEPVAVVLDTLNRSLRGSESSDEDMAAYVKAADAIKDAFECAVLIIHHCGHNDTRPRGHSSLTAAADVQVKVSRDAADNIIAEVEVAKDGPQGHSLASRLEVVEVGEDAEGERITSCVVVAVDESATRDDSTRRKLSNNQQLALREFYSLIDVADITGETLRLSDGLEVQAVAADRWREALLSRGIIDRAGKNPRADFKRLRESLKTKNLIGEKDGKLWLIRAA